MTHATRRLAVLLAVLMTSGLSSWSVWAQPDCAVGQAPSPSPDFVRLHERLGDVMGEPLGCEHDDWATGDAYMQTSTGIAVYRKVADRLIFTNGREFWSLNGDGLAHWSGWHGQAGPLGTEQASTPEDEQITVASVGHYPRVQAATIVRTLDAEGHQLVLQQADAAYQVDVRDGCADGQPLEGRRVFVVSNEAFAEPGSRLILRLSGQECVIAASHSL